MEYSGVSSEERDESTVSRGTNRDMLVCSAFLGSENCFIVLPDFLVDVMKFMRYFWDNIVADDIFMLTNFLLFKHSSQFFDYGLFIF